MYLLCKSKHPNIYPSIDLQTPIIHHCLRIPFFEHLRLPSQFSFLVTILFMETTIVYMVYMIWFFLTLDNKPTFEEHFASLEPRVEGMANLLGRLLPNIKGPEEKTRRLYAGITKSMALYGALIWAKGVTSGKNNSKRRIQMKTTIRIVRAYRNVSYRTVTTHAGMIPLDLQVKAKTEVYNKVQQRRREGASD